MVTASLSLILVLAVIGLKLTGRIDWLSLIVCVLTGASVAALLTPVLTTLGGGLSSATAMLSGMLG